MKQSFYNFILTVLAGIALILPFTGKVHDGRRKWFKGFTLRGWILFYAVLASVAVNYFKDLQAEVDDVNKQAKVDRLKRKDDSINKIEKLKDDSIARNRNDESNAKIVSTFTSSLAKYGLKYDSTQRVIQKLVLDSSKKEIKIITRNNPELSVCDIKLESAKADTMYLNISLCCDQANAYNVMINLYEIVEVNNNFIFIKRNNKFTNGNQIQSQSGIIIRYPYTYYHIINKIYFLFKGPYKNSNNSTLNFKDLRCYDVSRKQFGYIELEDLRKKVISTYHNNRVNY